jgi:hypothetical protein
MNVARSNKLVAREDTMFDMAGNSGQLQSNRNSLIEGPGAAGNCKARGSMSFTHNR